MAVRAADAEIRLLGLPFATPGSKSPGRASIVEKLAEPIDRDGPKDPVPTAAVEQREQQATSEFKSIA